MHYIIIILGGIIPIMLLSLLFERLLFKSIEPINKIVYSITLSFVVVTILSGFGNMNGGSFNPYIIEYLASSFLVGAARLFYTSFRGKKAR